MKQIICVFTLCVLSQALWGQQLPQFRQIAQSPSLYNPSAMGLQKQNYVSLIGKWQMLGFGYEPKTIAVYGQYQVKKKPKTIFNPGSRIQKDFTPVQKRKSLVLKHIVGGQVISDNYGAFKYLEVNGSYALSIPIQTNWKATIGLRLGLRNNSFNPSLGKVLNVQDVQMPYAGGDMTYDEITANNQRSMEMTSAAGLTLSSKKSFFSVSVQHGGVPNGFVKQTSFFDQRMHFNAMLGRTFAISSGLDIQPVLIVKKMSPAPISIELSTVATINYIFWFGFNYQYNASAGIMAGMEVSDNLKIGYAIDFSTNRINKFSNGGHEIYLSYGF